MTSKPAQDLRIAIIGGGAAGTLAACQLARIPSVRLVTMLDRSGRFGRGLAYSTTSGWHRLNVPAFKMGGSDETDPEGFTRWLKARGHELGPDYADTFVARHLYGDYLCALMAPLLASGRVTQQRAQVVAIARDDRQYRLLAAEGPTILADAVVLCIGNQEPSAPARIGLSPRYVNNVWAPGALEGIGVTDDILIIGTGATAVDVALDLNHRGLYGAMVMVSRRGLMPLIDIAPTIDEHPIDAKGMTLRALTRALRRDVERKAQLGIPWQAVIDAFRIAIPSLWMRMSDVDRRCFLRHLRSIWMVHRHRMAPDVAARLAALRDEGRLRVIAARLKVADPTDNGYRATFKLRGSNAEMTLATNWILNCTGPEENYHRVNDPLACSLLATGAARPGPFGLGLDVSEFCQLLNSAGELQPRMYLIGAATRGRFWEVTAVPNIRAQVTTMVQHLGASCGNLSAT